MGVIDLSHMDQELDACYLLQSYNDVVRRSFRTKQEQSCWRPNLSKLIKLQIVKLCLYLSFKTDEERTIQHLQYTAWPDHGML